MSQQGPRRHEPTVGHSVSSVCLSVFLSFSLSLQRSSSLFDTTVIMRYSSVRTTTTATTINNHRLANTKIILLCIFCNTVHSITIPFFHPNQYQVTTSLVDDRNRATATAATTAAAADTMITTVESSSSSPSSQSKSRMSSPLVTLKYILLDVPLWLTLLVAGLAWMTNDFYHGPMQTLVESYRRSGQVDPEGYYPDFFPDITYYARQCTGQDVTTQSSNDIVFRIDDNNNSNTTATATSTSSTATTRPEEEAADIMMKHGAILVPQILTLDTARQLRDYLETRNQIKEQLSWFEKFWGDIGRLSLGLGVDDAPIIAQALKEVATHPGLNAVLQGIVGEDPAVVEISTLTTLQGAQPQGIHTDSDFFGSSLLYSRTFLHSYTLFMALQDTTPRMGATTICPGTHWCANDDLSDVCGPRSSNAFEVSSNGKTGKDVGMLHTGDGMMFNQNIWHRGPKNSDPDRPMNRVMFIVTFVSRLALEEGDVRQQGIGTYYYQRWNMWGHTLNDLKRAGQTMWQPVAALKALGLFKMPGGQWGILWLEHFARQLANREDFFATYELPDFLSFLDDKLGMPRWLQGRPERETRNDRKALQWESFLKQLGTNISELCLQIHLGTLGVYVIVSFVGVVVLGAAGHNRMAGIASLLQRILQTYLMAGLVFGCLWYYVNHVSYISKRIQMRDSWREPFSPVQSMEHLQRTTFPTRSDVLVGSRFDAPYLSSFDKVLDYHPGNVRFARALNKARLDMPVLLEASVRPGRFLQQDHVTGYWMQMDASQVQSYLQRQVYAREFPLVGKLDEHLKQVLANARFGKTRETALSRRFTPAFVEHWQSILYRSLEAANDYSSTSFAATQLVPVSKKQSGWNKLTTALASTPKSAVSAMSSSLRSPSTRPRMYKPMRHFVQGDAVDVLADDDQYWDPATILYIDPFARATVRYDESGEEELVYLSIIRHAVYDDEALDEEEEEIIILEEGSRVMARFEGSGKFFPGYVDAVVSDNVYAIQFDDGDYDAKVPLESIVASGAASPAYG